ncbi:MAG: hypothetical protein U1E53_13110 [Dongiaceae bacterium]
MAFPMYRGMLTMPNAGDLTPEQIAQMQAGGDPYAQGWQPFAPRAAALSTIGQGLTGLGAGLLSGRNWAEGLSHGLLAASQGMQQASQDARRDIYVDQQGRSMQRRMQQEDRQTAREDEAAERKAASIEALASNPPAGVDPVQWRSLVMRLAIHRGVGR